MREIIQTHYEAWLEGLLISIVDAISTGVSDPTKINLLLNKMESSIHPNSQGGTYKAFVYDTQSYSKTLKDRVSTVLDQLLARLLEKNHLQSSSLSERVKLMYCRLALEDSPGRDFSQHERHMCTSEQLEYLETHHAPSEAIPQALYIIK